MQLSQYYKLILGGTFILLFLSITFEMLASAVSPSNDLNENQSEVELPGTKLYLEAIRNANDSIQKIAAYYDYGLFLNNEGELEHAIEQLELALHISENITDNKKIAQVANSLAASYLMIGDLNTSTQMYLKALESAELNQDITEIAKISMNLAGNYNFFGDYNNAIEYGLYALKTKESNNNWVRICYHYMAMSNIFKEMGNLNKREEYALRAYKMKDVETCASISDIAKIYNALGGIAEQKLEHEKALAYYDTLIVLSEDANFNSGVNSALINSSLIYQELGEHEKALDLVLQADEFSDNTPYDVVFSNNCKTDLYYSLGQAVKALDLANENIQKEEIEYYSAERLKCLRFLYEINFSLGNFQQAYNWNDSLQTYQEYLRDQDVRSTIEELETKYQTDKKEQQIELLQAENRIKHQEILAFIATTMALLLLVFVGMLLYFKKKKENQLHRLTLRQQLLRSQMNPHFLFNALGSIQNYMYKNETKKAAGYLGNFASLTRSILEHSAEEFVPLSAEIETLHNYIKLEQMRTKNNFDYKIEYDEELDTEFINVPPMLVQPFVENAIKHGLKNIEYPGFLSINFAENKGKLEIKVVDNGDGINSSKADGSKAKAHRSMSMQIFKERQDILSQRFKKNVIFELIDRSERNSTEKGTEVLIVIPV